MKAHESGLSVSTRNEPKITANVTLTSPLVREENSEGVATPGMTSCGLLHALYYSILILMEEWMVCLWVPFIYFRYLLCETHLFADKLTTDRQILFITFPSTSPKCLAVYLLRVILLFCLCLLIEGTAGQRGQWCWWTDIWVTMEWCLVNNWLIILDSRQL